MNIAVCVKQVPGTTEVEVDPVTGVLKRDGIDTKMNPYDLYAVETAVWLKEKTGGTVSVLSMGPPQAAEVIRETYMMGADEGTLISDRRFAGADVLATSYTLAQGVKKIGNSQLIICGKQTTDGDTAQVGPEMAEFLGMPHVANVLAIHEVAEDHIIVDMDMPESVERVKVALPCLITVEKGIFQPRLPSFKLKMATEDREVKMISLDDLDDRNEKNYGLNGSPTQVLKIFPPKGNDSHEKWEGSGQEIAGRLFGKLEELKFV